MTRKEELSLFPEFSKEFDPMGCIETAIENVQPVAYFSMARTSFPPEFAFLDPGECVPVSLGSHPRLRLNSAAEKLDHTADTVRQLVRQGISPEDLDLMARQRFEDKYLVGHIWLAAGKKHDIVVSQTTADVLPTLSEQGNSDLSRDLVYKPQLITKGWDIYESMSGDHIVVGYNGKDQPLQILNLNVLYAIDPEVVKNGIREYHQADFDGWMINMAMLWLVAHRDADLTGLLPKFVILLEAEAESGLVSPLAQIKKMQEFISWGASLYEQQWIHHQNIIEDWNYRFRQTLPTIERQLYGQPYLQHLTECQGLSVQARARALRYQVLTQALIQAMKEPESGLSYLLPEISQILKSPYRYYQDSLSPATEIPPQDKLQDQQRFKNFLNQLHLTREDFDRLMDSSRDRQDDKVIAFTQRCQILYAHQTGMIDLNLKSWQELVKFLYPHVNQEFLDKVIS